MIQVSPQNNPKKSFSVELFKRVMLGGRSSILVNLNSSVRSFSRSGGFAGELPITSKT